jgi:hypothetical protein
VQRFILERTLQVDLGRLDRCIVGLGELHRVYQEAGVPGTRLSPNQQQKTVRRHLDRILRFLRRKGLLS